MDLPKLLSDFQVRFDDKLPKLTHFLGIYYANWDHFKQLILTVAEKLGNPITFENLSLRPYLNLFPGCMYTLMTHEFKPRDWDVASFVLVLNNVDPHLTKMFLCIINAVINHPDFGPYAVHYRKNCRIHLGYKTVRMDHFEYFGFEFYDALVEINGYFLKFIPVHRSMPFFQSRLPLCDLDIAQFRESSLRQRQQMIVISGLSGLLVRRLFFKDTRLSSRMFEQILLQNFKKIDGLKN
jgi:hypothetical protein